MSAAMVAREVGVGGWATLRVIGLTLRSGWRNRRWGLVCLAVWVVWAVAHIFDVAMSSLGWVAGAWLLPGFVGGVWAVAWPFSFDRWVGWPLQRREWRRWIAAQWDQLAMECGLGVTRALECKGEVIAVPRVPRLLGVSTEGFTVRLRVRTRVGQTVQDLERAAPALASAVEAVSWTCMPENSATLVIDLLMLDALAEPRETYGATPGAVEDVPMGWAQDGSEWRLRLVGRHTLVAGCSGAGKGSVLWGVCGGLADSVGSGVVRLWGIDLKRGVEIGMGSALFCTVAVDPESSVRVLRELLDVIDRRGRAMAGVSRLHEPSADDPQHVLVIDELATLTAYSDTDTRREAGRLLAEILTQGRALGVVVVACVQDPRKEVVTMRGLFTQTVALRLRSADETRMVLGEGMAERAPAHRISPDRPGEAWVVDDQGNTSHVRAMYWSDEAIRATADQFGAEEGTPSAEHADGPMGVTEATSGPASQPRRRSPRKVRVRGQEAA